MRCSEVFSSFDSDSEGAIQREMRRHASTSTSTSTSSLFSKTLFGCDDQNHAESRPLATQKPIAYALRASITLHLIMLSLRLR